MKHKFRSLSAVFLSVFVILATSALAAEFVTPPIQFTDFQGVSRIDNEIGNNELVLLVNHKGVEKVYPLQFLSWHQVINDKTRNERIIVTYSTLSGTAKVFQRDVLGDDPLFGAVGFDEDNNIILKDKKTNSLWSQETGKPFSTNLTLKDLVEIPSTILTWEEVLKKHSRARVVEIDNQYSRPYGLGPYGDYFTTERRFPPFQPKNDVDLKPLTQIIGIDTLGGITKAYRLEDLEREIIINDRIGKREIELELHPDGTITATQIPSEEAARLFYIPDRTFKITRTPWFSWMIQNPWTEIYKPN